MGFIDNIKANAIDIYNRYGILPSLSISQAVLESGWGESGLTKNANNLFGYKGTGTAGSVEMPTKEWNAETKQYETVLADFRAYNSWGESFDDYGKLLSTSSYYKDVMSNQTDWKTAVAKIDASPYATDPEYGAKLTDIIIKNELYKLDAEVTGKPVDAVSGASGVVNTGISLPNLNPFDWVKELFFPSTDNKATGEGAEGFFDLAPDGVLQGSGEFFKSAGFVIGGLLLVVLGAILIFGIGNAVMLVADAETGGMASVAKEVANNG